MNQVSESPWVHKGIYLVKNQEAVASYCKDGIKFKVKNIRPILYFCTVCQNVVYLHLINSTNQFATANATPESMSRAYAIYPGRVEVKKSVADFELLGQETGLDNYFDLRWGYCFLPRTVRKDLFTKWEKVAIEKGLFTPSINPDYKSDKEKKQASALDFFGQEVKVGDRVAYTILSGHQKIHTGVVSNITDKNFVIKRGIGPGFYATPHKCTIKCPDGFVK